METKSALLLAALITLAWSTPCVFAGTAGDSPREPESPSKIIQSDEGKIDGDTYVVQIVMAGGALDFLLLKATGGAPVQISRMALVGDSAAYQVKIARDSFYLREETAHHGVFSATYQFKVVNKAFQLVGLETQSMASCMYLADFPDAQNEPCTSLQMWSGTSIDFLTSKAECWLQTFSLGKGERSRDWKRWEAASGSFDRGIRSSEAMRRTVALRPAALTPLDQFDLYNFRAPNTCYFDYKGGLHSP